MSQAVSPRKTPWQFNVLHGITLIGIALSVYLTQHFYAIRGGTAGFKSFCNLSATLNCDVVAASPYAEFAFGLPLSSFAAGWFLALFFLSLIGRNAFWRTETVRALFAFTGAGTLIGLVYLLIMTFSLKTFCLQCLGIDAVNLISFILVLSLKPLSLKARKLEKEKWKALIPLSIGALLATVWGLKSFEQSFGGLDVQKEADLILNSPAVPLKLDPSSPHFGPDNAPITVVEFSDFQCPFCRIGAYTLNSVINRYPKQIRVLFKNFPLDQACNPVMTRGLHPSACEAAKVSVCAHKVGKFEEIYQKLFEEQASFPTHSPREIGVQAGLNASQLGTCVQATQTNNEILKDIQEGTTLKVQSTPTFFVNGHKMEGVLPLVVWERVIEKLLTNEPHR